MPIDETWIHHYTPESEQQEKQWVGPSGSALKLEKTQQSAEKDMTFIFWDSCGILFIDYLKKHTSNEVIRRAMVRQEVPIAVFDWTCHMLENRNIKITKGNTHLRGIVKSGCPQGGILSPLLWSLVVDELLPLLTDRMSRHWIC